MIERKIPHHPAPIRQRFRVDEMAHHNTEELEPRVRILQQQQQQQQHKPKNIARSKHIETLPFFQHSQPGQRSTQPTNKAVKNGHRRCREMTITELPQQSRG
jgi:hypothetical protein